MTNTDESAILDQAAEQFLRIWGQVVQFMGPGPDTEDLDASLTLRRPFNQLKVLRELRGGPLSMSQIAQLLGVTNAAVTGIADRLEKKGLVQRVQDPTDRRVVCVQLTPEGYMLQRENHQRAVDWTTAVLARLGPQEAATFGRLLAKIEESIIENSRPMPKTETERERDEHSSNPHHILGLARQRASGAVG